MKWIGSSDKITTVAENEEVITQSVKDQGRHIKKFDFLNLTDCHIKINGSDPIFLSAGQGFNSDSSNPPIKSIVVVETGVEYQYIGLMSQ